MPDLTIKSNHKKLELFLTANNKQLDLIVDLQDEASQMIIFQSSDWLESKSVNTVI